MTDTDDYRRPPAMLPRRIEPEPQPTVDELREIYDSRLRGMRNSFSQECGQRKALDRLKTAAKYREAAE